MGTFDPERHRRQSIRLQGYDYGQPGMYFVTVSTFHGRPIFGHIRDGVVHLSAAGKIVEEEWMNTPAVRNGVLLDHFIVMPDHLHGILVLEMNRNDWNENVFSSAFRSPSQTVGAIVRGFKAASTRRINAARPEQDRGTVWHRNYYEHIIRNDADLNRIRDYIAANPANWKGSGHE